MPAMWTEAEVNAVADVLEVRCCDGEGNPLLDRGAAEALAKLKLNDLDRVRASVGSAGIV
jgi:hypothetical protein